MQDTRTIGTGRPMFIGSELLPLVRKMKDPFDEKAFIEVYKYADAGSVLEGEVGNIADFRVVVADEMMHWPAEAHACRLGRSPTGLRSKPSTG